MARQANTAQEDVYNLEEILVNTEARPMKLPPALVEIIKSYEWDHIGSGGFAIVYKVEHHGYPFAIKEIHNTSKFVVEFNQELDCLMKVQHPNVVRFLAFHAGTNLTAQIDKGGKFKSMSNRRNRLLLFEYAPNGTLAAYIKRCFPKGSSGDLEWSTHYQIILGICKGLSYIHEQRIFHLDLNPKNILLDTNGMPKIADFGISRCLDEGKTCIVTPEIFRTSGYAPPESNIQEENNKSKKSNKSTKPPSYVITFKWDLYNLGLIIMEMLTGNKDCRSVTDVHRIWSNKTTNLQEKQLKVCAQIAMECTEKKPSKRPESMKCIVDRLEATEIQADEPNKFLVYQPSRLRFQFEANKVVTCLLKLTNKTNDPVAFRLMNKSGGPSFLRLPLYGLVLPKIPYTLAVTTLETTERPATPIIVLILNSATIKLGNEDHRCTFQSQPDKFFQDSAAKKVELIAHCAGRPQDIATSPSEPAIKVKCLTNNDGGPSDTNHDKKWVIRGQKDGEVHIWDYDTQKINVGGFKPWTTRASSLKCIARKKCIVSGGPDGLHVYNYETRTRDLHGMACDINALAVHPTQSYLLVAGKYMQLLNLDKKLKCDQTFHLSNSEEVDLVEFSQNEFFATVSWISGSVKDLVKVWSIHSSKSIYTISEHSESVNCLDFFTCQRQQFLVTGSYDNTAKIWSLEERKCVRTLETFVFPVTSVKYQHSRETLITGSEDGVIYLWSITNCSVELKGKKKPSENSWSVELKEIIKLGCVGAVNHLACDRKWVVIGTENAVAIMDMGNVNDLEQLTDHSERQFYAVTGPHAGDPTSKDKRESFSELLGVHPLELRFPCHPDEPIPCSLHLTNNTNENVAFRLVDKSGKSPWCFRKLLLYGIVPPGSIYTLIVRTKEEMMLEKMNDFNLVIQSFRVGDKYNTIFDDLDKADKVFKEATLCGTRMHEVTLKAICVDFKGITFKNISVMYSRDVWSVDAHPTNPWVLTGHYSGIVSVWKHEMKHPSSSFEVSKTPVDSVFFAKKERLVAMVEKRYLHVYKCASPENIEKDETIDLHDFEVRPSARMYMSAHTVLLGREKLKEKTHTVLLGWFEGAVLETKTLDPEYDGSYNLTSGYFYHQIRVYKYDGNNDESVVPHLKKLRCLAWITCGDNNYSISSLVGQRKHDLITGSHDGTAKVYVKLSSSTPLANFHNAVRRIRVILKYTLFLMDQVWDLDIQKCVGTLEAMSPVLCVLVHPNRPAVITGTEHGIIQVWSSTDFKLKRTINFGGGGCVRGLAWLAGPERLVVLQENAICIMDNPEDETTML